MKLKASAILQAIIFVSAASLAHASEITVLDCNDHIRAVRSLDEAASADLVITVDSHVAIADSALSAPLSNTISGKEIKPLSTGDGKIVFQNVTQGEWRLCLDKIESALTDINLLVNNDSAGGHGLLAGGAVLASSVGAAIALNGVGGSSDSDSAAAVSNARPLAAPADTTETATGSNGTTGTPASKPDLGRCRVEKRASTDCFIGLDDDIDPISPVR